MIPSKLLIPQSILVLNGVRYKYAPGTQILLGVTGPLNLEVIGRQITLSYLASGGGASGEGADIGLLSGAGGLGGGVASGSTIVVAGKLYKVKVGAGGARAAWLNPSNPGDSTYFQNFTDSTYIFNLAGGSGPYGTGVGTYDKGWDSVGNLGAPGGGTGDNGGGPPNPGTTGGSGGNNVSGLLGGPNGQGFYSQNGGTSPGGSSQSAGQGDGNAQGGDAGLFSGGGASGLGLLVLGARYGAGGGGGGGGATAQGGKGGSGIILLTMV